ncbi:MAG: sterol desaturase family protein [Rhodanobacter sp.]
MNLVAGGWVLLTISLSQLLLGVVWSALLHAMHRTQAPVALDQGYPGASVLGGLAWMVLYDGAYYAFHRAQHCIPWLWRFHAVHHSDTAMNSTTYLRQHMLESVLQSFILLLPLILVFRMSPASFLIVSLVSAGLQFWAHADVPVHYGRGSWLLCSPLVHRVHHTRDAQVGEGNFASVFPVFDVLFGTFKAPGDRQRIATGLFDGTTWHRARDLWCADPRDRQAMPRMVEQDTHTSLPMDVQTLS